MREKHYQEGESVLSTSWTNLKYLQKPTHIPETEKIQLPKIQETIIKCKFCNAELAVHQERNFNFNYENDTVFTSTGGTIIAGHVTEVTSPVSSSYPNFTTDNTAGSYTTVVSGILPYTTPATPSASPKTTKTAIDRKQVIAFCSDECMEEFLELNQKNINE